MFFSAARISAAGMCVSFILCTILCNLARAECRVDTVIVKGRVENAPPKAKVRVELVYAKEQVGDSGEATLENATFSIPIEFLTLSRRPVLMGNLREKCDRKPKTVVVTLVEGDQKLDSVSLDFAKDFWMADPTAYTLRSEVVLNGSR
jgi:hypothetical protein